MHYTEIIFFGCFIVFIVGILMLDMLVIDKEAHEVSMKEAGAWTAVWITLALLFPFSYGFTVIWYMVSTISPTCRKLPGVMLPISNSTLMTLRGDWNNTAIT